MEELEQGTETKVEEIQEANVVIEKSTMSDEELAKKQQTEDLLAKLQGELDKLQEELDLKKYIVDGGKTIAQTFLDFIKNEAKWKFTESLGIIQVSKYLEEFLSNSKQKELMLGPLEVEAIYYFLSRSEGVGIESATKCLSMLKAINPAKAHKEEDSKKFEEINFRINSLQHGIDPEEIKERLACE
jgi:hypothetical protein